MNHHSAVTLKGAQRVDGAKATVTINRLNTTQSDQ